MLRPPRDVINAYIPAQWRLFDDPKYVETDIVEPERYPNAVCFKIDNKEDMSFDQLIKLKKLEKLCIYRKIQNDEYYFKLQHLPNLKYVTLCALAIIIMKIHPKKN